MVKIELLMHEWRAKRRIHKNSGAGENVASWDDMVLNNPSPLYELVWYPRDGLRLKYASPKMVEEKTASFWNPESFDVTISSPRHSNNAGQNIRTGAPAKDEFNSMTSKLDSEMMDFLNSHTSAGFSLTKSLAQDLRSSRDMDSRGKENERRRQGVGTSNTVTGARAIEEERRRLSNPGQKDADDLIVYSESCLLKGKMPVISPKYADHVDDVGLSEVNCKDFITNENYQKSSFFAVSDFGDHVAESTRPVSSSKSPRLNYADLETKDADENIIRTTNHISNFKFFRVQCSSGANLERQQVHRPHPQHLEKGKQKVLYSEKDCGITSKEREDSNESVESNSRKVVSERKRARNDELTAKVDCKRLRKECGGSSSSEPLFRKANSFMNWISSITSSYSRCDHNNKILAILPQDSNGIGCFDSIPKLEEKSEGVRCRTRGFASVFQAIYSPSMMAGNCNHSILSHDEHLEEANNGEELNTGNPQVNGSEELNIGIPPVHEGPELNLNSVCIQNEKLNSFIMPHEVRHPVIGDLRNGEVKEVNGKELDHDNTSSNCGRMTHAEGKACLPRIMEPLSPSRKNILICAEEDGNQAFTIAPNNSVNTDVEGNNCLFQSSWISRLMSRDSPSISRPFVCRLEMDVVSQKLKNQNIMEDKPRLGVSYFGKKPENLVNCFASHVESQRLIITSPELQQYSISPTASSGSKRPEDQRNKHNLAPILASEKFEKPEPISSLFAKRLDALRHKMPSKVADNLSCAATTCFFCGKVGHSLRNCSSLVDSDLNNLLEFLKSHKGNKLPQPFCIRCFQVNHWAIACPRSLIKLKNNTGNPPTVSPADLNGADKKAINENDPNYDGRIILWTGGNIKEHQRHDKLNFMAQRVDSRYEVDSDSTIKRSFREISPPIANSCYQNLSKEYLSKGTAKSKQSVFVGPQVDYEQNEIFEAITRLRLSRTEIMRLLKSESSHIRLEGFYLRLRLGKWDEGLGGTGYHVALINGASHENCVSVSIGHQKYSVNCRFVSNQDYSKEELKAWWLANSRGQGKLPSKEDLIKKIKERAELKL